MITKDYQDAPCIMQYRHVSNISRRCSNYIFMKDLTPGFNWLSKDNGNMRREAFQVWD